MVGAYSAVSFASLTEPKGVWTINPLTMTFSGGGGTSRSGSAGDSFKCAPDVPDPITLKTSVSAPTKISLSTDRSTFASCGPSFNSVTIIGHCLVAAPNCKGSYTGTIQIFQPSQYRTILLNLSVIIGVT